MPSSREVSLPEALVMSPISALRWRGATMRALIKVIQPKKQLFPRTYVG